MSSRVSKFFWRSIVVLILIAIICIGLLTLNGVYLANNETPLSGITSHATSNQPPVGVTEIKIMAYNAVQQGASGVDMGRNIFQAESPIAMLQAVRAVVHDNETPQKALDLYQTIKNQSS